MSTRSSLAAAVIAAAVAPWTWAETSPYYIGASQSLQHDNNLLRLGDNQTVPTGFSASDTISSTTLLAGFDQPISRQRVFGNLSASHNVLSHNKVYDNDSYALASGLDWATLDNLSGKLYFNANRNLARFNADQLGLVTEKNIQTTRLLDASVRLGGVGQFTFDADANTRSVDYSAAAYQPRIYRQDSLSAGVHYHPRAASTLGVALRQDRGRYPLFFDDGSGNRSPDRFRRENVDIDATLEPNAVSNVYLRLSTSRIHYDTATQRDFSSVGGLAKWTWRPSGKLRFESSLERAPSQDSYFQNYLDFSTFSIKTTTLEFSRISTIAHLRGDYEFSSKLSFNASFDSVHRSLTETVDASGAVNSGSETAQLLSLGGTWTPLRWLQAGCSLSTERRRGAAPVSSNLSDTSVSCFVQGTLQ